ncbi:MAG: phosphate ABC transporter substrate-binding protein [Steroidobacteraceae bacterium]
MLRRSGKLFLAALLLAGCATVRAADLYVICNDQVPLAAADVRDMFLGEKQFAGSVKLVPIDNQAAQSLFLQRVLKMSAEKYSVTWIKKSFRDGINPPLVAGSDAEALASVRRTPGACSYVTTPPTTNVAMVAKL